MTRAILLAAAIGAAAVMPVQAQQETGQLVMTVTDKQSGQPVQGAQIQIVGSRLGGLTNEQGRYLFPSLPVGTYQVTVQFIGFNEVRDNNVVVRAGQPTTLSVALEQAVLSLQALVVTGVTDPTAGVKLPFTVSSVGKEQLQVAATGSPLEMLSGKIAGAYVTRSSGRPGADVEIQLRSPTGFEMSSRPLFVIDGVVVATDNLSSPLSDIDPNEIENIEVIKGAAASSLYGSRAAAGVVSITTNRGRNLERNTMRITARTEYGKSMIAKQLKVTNAHMLLMDEGRTTLVNAAGEPIKWNDRVVDPATRRMFIHDYPGTTYDNVSALYNPGEYLSNAVTFQQSADNSTLVLSVSRRSDEGAMVGNRGRQQYNGRFSVDHRMGDKLTVSMTGQASRLWDDGESGNPYTSIMTYPAYVDLTRRDSLGNYIMVPDPSVEVENPIWRQSSRDNWSMRVRTWANLNTRYSLARWLTLDAQVSYDRADSKNQAYVPKGTPTSATTDAPSLGQLELRHQENNAYNGSAGATFMRQFGDLNARLTARGTFEKEYREGFDVDGRQFVVGETRDLTTTRIVDDWNSNTTDVRANGLLSDLGLDFKDRYIANFVVRRDGSSLFGPDNKWHTYRRASGKWRISQEPFFSVPFVNELGIRYAMGEAGGRPGYTDQYEQWSVSRSGGLTRSNAGNSQIRASFTREQEVGIDFIGFNNKVQLELVYANQVSRDQIITVPAVVATGYNSQRANAGELTGNTIEGSLQWNVLRKRDVTWSIGAVADRTTSKLTKWERSCFFGAGNANRGGADHEKVCAGEKVGQFWIYKFTQNASELPSWVRDRADEFDVNDDGYLVWVGKNPETGQPYTWRDGLKISQATECPAGTSGGCGWGSSFTAGGQTYRWGEPFLVKDEEALNVYHNLGSALPDLNFGFNTNVRYKRFSAYAGFRGQIGGKIYNRARNWGYATLRHADIDMRNVPEELRKTQDYFNRALAQSDGCNQISRGCGNFYSEFLEDATYLRLGEARLSYRVGRENLRRLMGSVAPADVNLGLNMTNLFTLTNGYTGINPEAGQPLSRQEIVNYPFTRSVRLTVDITF